MVLLLELAVCVQLIDGMTATNPTAEPSQAAKVPVVSLLIAVVLGGLVSASVMTGAIYYVVRSGRLRIPVGTSTESKGAFVKTSSHALTLEPLLVNLADSGGGAYLRVGLTLRVFDSPEKADAPKQAKESPETTGEAKEVIAALRDTALAVLGRQTSADLLAPDGKERLKDELQKAIAKRNEEIKVSDLYFTEFLVQR